MHKKHHLTQKTFIRRWGGLLSRLHSLYGRNSHSEDVNISFLNAHVLRDIGLIEPLPEQINGQKTYAPHLTSERAGLIGITGL